MTVPRLAGLTPPGLVEEVPTLGKLRPNADVDERELLQALRESAWDLKATAERLGISRASVYMLIDRSSLLRTAGDLSAEEITRCFHECQGDVDKMVQKLEVSWRALQRRLREMGLSGA